MWDAAGAMDVVVFVIDGVCMLGFRRPHVHNSFIYHILTWSCIIPSYHPHSHTQRDHRRQARGVCAEGHSRARGGVPRGEFLVFFLYFYLVPCGRIFFSPVLLPSFRPSVHRPSQMQPSIDSKHTTINHHTTPRNQVFAVARARVPIVKFRDPSIPFPPPVRY